MTMTTSRAAGLCEAAGLRPPGTIAGYVERRETAWGTRLLDEVAPEALGAWQAGGLLLVEEERKRRERGPFGDRWPTRYTRYLVIEEPARADGSSTVHLHPVPKSAGSVRAALAWALRVPEAALAAIDRVQGDVYVLRREGAAARLRSDALPARHDVTEGRLVHPVHAAVAAAGSEEIYRTCRRAAVARHATGGSAD